MSEARTVSYELPATRSDTVTRQWLGVLLATVLLSAICAGEVLFLRYVGGPAAMNTIAAAEGMGANTD